MDIVQTLVGLDRWKLIAIASLVGTDYDMEGARGLGPVGALTLARNSWPPSAGHGGPTRMGQSAAVSESQWEAVEDEVFMRVFGATNTFAEPRSSLATSAGPEESLRGFFAAVFDEPINESLAYMPAGCTVFQVCCGDGCNLFDRFF